MSICCLTLHCAYKLNHMTYQNGIDRGAYIRSTVTRKSKSSNSTIPAVTIATQYITEHMMLRPNICRICSGP